MDAPAPALLPFETLDSPGIRWFGPRNCVLSRDGHRGVWVGGTLVGRYREDDKGTRNLLVVGLAADPVVHLGQLAAAFEISDETLRLLRQRHRKEGAAALLRHQQSGAKSKVTPAARKKLEALFVTGVSADEAHSKLGKRLDLGRVTVWRVRKAWQDRTASAAIETAVPPTHVAPMLPNIVAPQAPAVLAAEESNGMEPEPPVGSAAIHEAGCVARETEAERLPLLSQPTESIPVERNVRLRAVPPRDGQQVQHVGAWLLLATVHALGLYRRAEHAAEKRVHPNALRIALDAVIIALGVGERCVEGVRRLATSTAAELLLCTSAPSSTWTRQLLGRLAMDDGAARLHLEMATEYAVSARAAARGSGPVFYVDNHMRPYTGQHVVRRGWRMQDKRVRPGTSDYYVHDEDGRPVGRVSAPNHGSLTDFLTPIAETLRVGLGDEETILLAFDRAGAFPEQMAELRNEGFEFVTYERRPFPKVPARAFAESVTLGGENFGIFETRTNLGDGRGRVRRIAVRTPQQRQINLLAVSKRPASELLAIMKGRWQQENAFKHGNERWGINELDGRRVVPTDPETVIPNPARRRLERALKLARENDGRARRELARLPETDERRQLVQADLDEAVAQQRELQTLRPTTPTHAPLRDTELAGKLVQHTGEYKLVIDTIRIACANAESELAADLAPLLPRGREAKKALANLLASPGRIVTEKNAIRVMLRPAGSPQESAAFEAFLSRVNQRRLSHPGDPLRRQLYFGIDQVS